MSDTRTQIRLPDCQSKPQHFQLDESIVSQNVRAKTFLEFGTQLMTIHSLEAWFPASLQASTSKAWPGQGRSPMMQHFAILLRPSEYDFQGHCNIFLKAFFHFFSLCFETCFTAKLCKSLVYYLCRKFRIWQHSLWTSFLFFNFFILNLF